MRRNVRRLLLICAIGGVVGACVPPGVDDDSTSAGVADPGAIVPRIAALDGVLDVKDWSGGGNVFLNLFVPDGCKLYWVTFRQPVDHAQPNGDTFSQRLVLQHCGDDRPMVFSPDGYGYDVDFFQPELVSRLQANWLWVEQRYFGPSTPANDPNGDYLRVRQAADDHHAVVSAFKHIYRKRWISTGASKGGVSSTLFRYFYPDDVDGTVAYVAPLVLDYGDTRFPPFIEQQGDADCHARLLAYQRALLSRSDELLTEMRARAAWADPATAFRKAAILYRFVFWQYLADCSSTPDPTSDAGTMIDTLLSSAALLTDSDNAKFASYWAQTKTELGMPAEDRVGLEDLLTVPPDPKPDTYSSSTLSKIASWVHTDARRFVFIYGDHDPWSAAAADPDPSLDNTTLLAPGHGHEADLTMVPDGALREALARISAWADVPLIAPQSAAIDLERKGRLRAIAAAHAALSR
jgi:hypothetical protein